MSSSLLAQATDMFGAGAHLLDLHLKYERNSHKENKTGDSLLIV